MGHSEMLLAVAGLGESQVKERAKNLAAGDWSDFPPVERRAFAFAHRIAKEPAKITGAEMRGLVATFGPNRTVDLVWYGAWCNYMTRVADAFQLPLEKENAFAPREKK